MARSHEPRARNAAERLRPELLQGAAFVMIAAFAALLRFWNLDVRTFHPDESTSSLIAAQLASGAAYEHLPSLHGPLHYAGTAVVFRIAGDSDFTARVLPALAGVLLAMLPFAFTRHIGRVGATVSALLLCVSPSLLYYSRFANHEIYLALATASLAMLTWRYLARPERPMLYAMSVVLALMFVSSEMALVVAPIFVAYLAYLTAAGFHAQMAGGAETSADALLTHYELLGVAHNASDKEIRKAYRALIDKTSSRAQREALAHAYGVLTDGQRRAKYDRKLARAALSQRPAGPHGFASKATIAITAPVIALLWPFVGGLRARMNLRRLPDAASPMLVIALLALPFYGPLVQYLPFVGDRGFEGQQMIYVIGGENRVPGGELPVMHATLAALVVGAAILGWMWRWNAWVICWAAFNGIAVAMFTGFFANQGGIWTGYWGTLDYWMRPEAEVSARAPYYYGMLAAVYEFVPLGVAAAAVVALMARGTARDRAVAVVAAMSIAAIIVAPSWTPLIGAHKAAFILIVALASVLALRLPPLTRFLAFWAVGAFLAFSAVPAKEPWLMVHVAVPMALLAGKLVEDAFAAVTVPRVVAPSLRAMLRPRLVQASVVATVAGMAVFALHAGLLASWGHGNVPQLEDALALSDAGDTPIELIQPDQTAPDVREVRDAIERASVETGLGARMPVAIDTSYEFARTWLWYLRDYENLALVDMRKGYDAPSDAVVLVDARNRGRVTGTQAALAVTYTQRWRFPHSLDASATDVASEFVTADAWSKWIDYLADRTTIGRLDATQGVAYFPRDLIASVQPLPSSDVLSSDTTPAE